MPPGPNQPYMPEIPPLPGSVNVTAQSAAVSTEDRMNSCQAAVTTAIDARQRWADGDEPYITEDLEAAVGDLLAVFHAGTIPEPFRAHAGCVAAMTPPWNDWQAEAIESGGAVAPRDEFWRAFDGLVVLEEEAEAPPKRRLEPIKLLREQKVGDEQIARMYGFVSFRRGPSGERESVAETWKVQEELDQPGRHTGPETGWRPPLEAKLVERERAKKAAAERVRLRMAAKLERANNPPPESLAELVQQGVVAEQIADMLNSTVQAVWAECDRQGLPRPKARQPITAAVSSLMSKENQAAGDFLEAGREGVKSDDAAEQKEQAGGGGQGSEGGAQTPSRSRAKGGK